MALSDNATITMPVAPAYQAGGYGSGMWGGDWSSWIILFLIFGMFGGWGWGNGWGGNNGGSGFGPPSGQGWATRADINEGFALTACRTASATLQPLSATVSMAWTTLCANWAITCSRALTRFPANWRTAAAPPSGPLTA